ncbi:hypothetical protein P8625_11085 [Tenacibaculum tangerinum]|uniref:Nicotinic acid mononucleotide adenyltransferase n=1 Tax=Tenacibaculum tangerinum TaxID=3038772 RepID=A0ABY8KZH7_9FLAO|nr:hypothetical protein [Tenacibaculum tangerinum]WGH74632.1 hypothetical protein P8625_11085 [Tenacibaculum tangerinum]
MKRIKLLLLLLISGVTFTSCVVRNEIVEDSFALNQYISSYDLWYIDYHRTTGSGDVPFLSRAFTISFINGTMYANNNIVDIGKTGNGLGIAVGNYRTYGTILEARHDIDGYYEFDIVQLSNNEIRIDDLSQNVSYYLIGYQRNTFDYDMLFYDNIEYFLQEFVAWERTDASGGTPNPFDEEHYLQFTPENNVTFYSSHDPFGTDVDYINWDYVGGYIVRDVQGVEDLKYLTLNYDNGDTEEFDLTVINDETIELYHVGSETTYVFSGRGFIQYLKGEKISTTKPAGKNSGRKRTKIKRQIVPKRT